MNPPPVNRFDVAEDQILHFAKVETDTLRGWHLRCLIAGVGAADTAAEIAATLRIRDMKDEIVRRMMA